MENKSKHSPAKITLPPVRIAVLVDGGFFIKRYNAVFNEKRAMTGRQVAHELYKIAHKHVGRQNILYRIFYYDCVPFEKKMTNPISGKLIDFKKTEEYKFRMDLFKELKQRRKVALRLGTLKDHRKWEIFPRALAELLKGKKNIKDLVPEDVHVSLQQKGIDMKIGVDIASLALKHFVDRIVLISGDSDFVPAAKLARREGIDFVLDPMGAHIDDGLFEHIDGLENSIKSRVYKK